MGTDLLLNLDADQKAKLLNSPSNLDGGLARKRRGTPKLTAPTGLSESKSESTSSLNQDTVGSDAKSQQFKDEDMKLIKNLGAGTGGTVSLVVHEPTGTKMARKVNNY